MDEDEADFATTLPARLAQPHIESQKEEAVRPLSLNCAAMWTESKDDIVKSCGNQLIKCASVRTHKYIVPYTEPQGSGQAAGYTALCETLKTTLKTKQ